MKKKNIHFFAIIVMTYVIKLWIVWNSQRLLIFLKWMGMGKIVSHSTVRVEGVVPTARQRRKRGPMNATAPQDYSVLYNYTLYPPLPQGSPLWKSWYWQRGLPAETRQPHAFQFCCWILKKNYVPSVNIPYPFFSVRKHPITRAAFHFLVSADIFHIKEIKR